MNYLNQQILAASERAIQFDTDHPRPEPIPRATVLFTELSGVAAEMRAYNAGQAAGLTMFRGGADERREAFFSLLGEMRVMNTIARGLNPADAPGFAELFRMPESRSYANIAAFGRAFVTNATGQEAVFTDRGLPAGFLVPFTARVNAAEQAVQSRNTGLINRSGATAGIAVTGRRAVAILRELNSIMTTALRNDPVLLAAWQTARHIARRARSRSAPAPGDSGSGTPPPSGS